MGLREQIDMDFTTSMKNKNELTRNAIRLLKTAISYEENKKGTVLNNEGLLEVVIKHSKGIEDQIKVYESLNQPHLVESLKEERAIFDKYIPSTISNTELMVIINDIFEGIPVESRTMKSMGSFIHSVTSEVKNKGFITNSGFIANTYKQLINA